MIKIDLDGLLSNQPLFRHISPIEFASLKTEVVNIRIGQTSSFGSKRRSRGCLLSRGLQPVEISDFCSNGSDKIIELIRPGQSLGI